MTFHKKKTVKRSEIKFCWYLKEMVTCHMFQKWTVSIGRSIEKCLLYVFLIINFNWNYSHENYGWTKLPISITCFM